jgi:exodeoxyribonuclease VII small subunit
MSRKKNPASNEDPPAFEESFELLQRIVAELEDGRLTLGASLEKYEQGIRHLRNCYRALNEAEAKIKMLVDVDADGNLITTEFESQPFDRDSQPQPLEPPKRSNDSRSARINEPGRTVGSLPDDPGEMDEQSQLF